MPEGQETSQGRGWQEDPGVGYLQVCVWGGLTYDLSQNFKSVKTPEKKWRERRMAVRGWPLRTGEEGNPDATSPRY